METLPLNKIRCDGGTQSRAFMDETAIAEYAEAMKEGAQFPPVVVFYDGTDYWMADGFHRARAAKDAGLTEINADVRQGDKRAAILFSVGANAISQVNRTSADKRRAVMVLLEDKEWSQWPQGEIAKTCKVSREYVNRVFQENKSSCDRSQDTSRKVERGGKTYEMKTGEIGKKDAETGTGQNSSPTGSQTSAQSRSNIESSEAERPAPERNGSEWQNSEWTSSNTPSINGKSAGNLGENGTSETPEVVEETPTRSPATLYSLCLELIENHVALLAKTPEAREWFGRLIEAMPEETNE